METESEMNNRPDWSQNPVLIGVLWLLALLGLMAVGFLFVYSEPGGHWDTDKIQRDWSNVAG